MHFTYGQSNAVGGNTDDYATGLCYHSWHNWADGLSRDINASGGTNNWANVRDGMPVMSSVQRRAIKPFYEMQLQSASSPTEFPPQYNYWRFYDKLTGAMGTTHTYLTDHIQSYTEMALSPLNITLLPINSGNKASSTYSKDAYPTAIMFENIDDQYDIKEDTSNIFDLGSPIYGNQRNSYGSNAAADLWFMESVPNRAHKLANQCTKHQQRS